MTGEKIGPEPSHTAIQAPKPGLGQLAGGTSMTAAGVGRAAGGSASCQPPPTGEACSGLGSTVAQGRRVASPGDLMAGGEGVGREGQRPVQRG